MAHPHDNARAQHWADGRPFRPVVPLTMSLKEHLASSASNGPIRMTPSTGQTFHADNGVFPSGQPSRADEEWAKDPEPWARRSLGTPTPSMFGDDVEPKNPVLHAVREMHPHLADYEFTHKTAPPSKGEEPEHEVRVWHTDEDGKRAPVAQLKWATKHGSGEYEPGEVTWVAVKKPATNTEVNHAGKGLATAMWDYAQGLVKHEGYQEPAHSSVRSTQGNHWAHFVGGATLARTAGFDEVEM